MLSYFIVFFMLIIIPKFFNKKRTNTICFFILFIFSGVRFDIGWDFRWYYVLANKFNYIKYDFFIDLNEVMDIRDWQFWEYYRIEFLNKVLYKIVWFLKMPQLIIFFYSFIILYFIKKGLDNRKIFNYNVWLFFYTFPIFYFQSLSVMRQWSAIGIILFSYKYIEKKEFFKFCLYIFIASLFHKISIIFIFLYFLQYIRINKRIHILLFSLSFFSAEILMKLLSLDIPIISNYKMYIFNSLKLGKSGGKIIYFLIIIIYVGILLLIYLDDKFYKKNQIIINYVCFGTFIYISLINLGHLTFRISQYFLIFIIYIFNEIERIIKNKLRISKICLLIIEFLFLFLFLSNDKNSVRRSQYIPYKVFILNNNINYNKWFIN